MIRKIAATKKDAQKLRSLRVDPKFLRDDFFKYAGIVIKKPWGYEYLIFENESIAVWVLYIQQDFQTSLHCHPNKKTSLIVLSGKALCSTIHQTIEVNPGEGFLIEPGVFHQTRAVSLGGVVVMETETPNNKRDLVRLDDKYGREQKGYEGKEHHIPLSDLDYLSLESFHELSARYNTEKIIGQCALQIIKHTPETLRSFWSDVDAHAVCILRGSLLNSRKPVYTSGDMINMVELKRRKNLGIAEEVELLVIRNVPRRKS